jgi:hypothetical protein
VIFFAVRRFSEPKEFREFAVCVAEFGPDVVFVEI